MEEEGFGLSSDALIGLSSDSDAEWRSSQRRGGREHSSSSSSSSSDSEGEDGSSGGLRVSGSSVLFGTRLGPSGYAPYVPGPEEEDVCPEYEFDTENTELYIEPGKSKPRKKRSFSIPSLLLPISERTPKGRASGTAAAIKKLVGSGSGSGGSSEVGPAYAHLISRGCSLEAAAEASARISDLLTISAIDTVLETFIKPLERSASSDPESRVHCSLNLNTETGRLSARRPNLQNQPSLERDRFRIRRAFVAPPGRRLVVADYGQLELRVLAHLTSCASMISAFAAGGDFHSRTAMGMYSAVRSAVESGEVLLEGAEGEGSASGASPAAPSAPLLKDRFKEERRKAKILNFSIAYGKTAYGLAKDWSVSLSEAEATVSSW